MRYGLLAISGVALLGFGMASAAAAPRMIPDHDVMGVYRIDQPGKPAQTWRVQYLAAGERVRAVSLSGQAAGVTILLDLVSGSANVVLPQMHAVVAVPGLSDLMQKVMDDRGAHYTVLGQATVAGHTCTRYLVLKPKGDGSACITQGGVVLEARGKDDRGSASVEALSIADTPQSPADFMPPEGYSSITLPPQMLEQLLGG
ncbi:MAG TPA: hypothetical protein VF286_11650 [Acidiphilium sp.]